MMFSVFMVVETSIKVFQNSLRERLTRCIQSHCLHYGVKGMKWGIRKDSKQTQIRARSGRLNSFGKDGHNILYIVGISGSGKSTLTINLANKLDAEPIHLDWYYDGRSKQKTPFSKFLKKITV